jgi:hypothetical protein
LQCLQELDNIGIEVDARDNFVGISHNLIGLTDNVWRHRLDDLLTSMLASVVNPGQRRLWISRGCG